MKYKKINFEQGSEKWLAFRKDKIGGSDIPSILALEGAYKSRNALLEEKVTGKTKDVTAFEQALFDRGHELEAVARERLEKHLGYALPPLVVQSKTNDLFIASLDGFNEERMEILEVKSTKNADKLAQAEREEATDIYYAQVQWQLLITGARYAHLAVINSETEELFAMQIVPNEEYQSKILASVAKFVDDKTKAVAPITDLQSTALDYIERSKRTISEYKKLIDIEEEKIKQEATKILDEYKATKIDNGKVKIEWTERKGNVEYSEIPELKGVDLDKYRKQPSRFIKITVKGE